MAEGGVSEDWPREGTKGPQVMAVGCVAPIGAMGTLTEMKSLFVSLCGKLVWFIDPSHRERAEGERSVTEKKQNLGLCGSLCNLLPTL